MNKPVKYAPEVRERAVRVVFEHQGDYESRWVAIGSIARRVACTVETLRKWVRQADRDLGMRAGLLRAGTAQGAGAGEPRAEVGQLDSTQGVVFFHPGGVRPQTEVMMAFIYAHRAESGVQPICRELPIAPSQHYEHKARQAEPAHRPARQHRDAELIGEIRRAHEEKLPGPWRPQGLATAQAESDSCGLL